VDRALHNKDAAGTDLEGRVVAGFLTKQHPAGDWSFPAENAFKDIKYGALQNNSLNLFSMLLFGQSLIQIHQMSFVR
jgi:hypothetical protein